MVGGGSMPIETAIPIVMGANIGTSVTNTLVSLGHIGRGREFERAFAASTIHDFFNIFAVVVLFPLQVTTNFLGVWSSRLAELFADVGGLTFASPLKMLTGPAVKAAANAARRSSLADADPRPRHHVWFACDTWSCCSRLS